MTRILRIYTDFIHQDSGISGFNPALVKVNQAKLRENRKEDGNG
jgi:hypothetical protein